MSLNTKPLDKKEKTKELRKKHEELLLKDGGPGARFFPKVAYLSRAVNREMVVAFFPSEMAAGADLYVEFITPEYDPMTPERTLLKWKFNSHYDTEYEKTDPHEQTGHVRYEVPVAELINVQDAIAVVNTKTEAPTFASLPDPTTDSPIGEMTLRDKAAVEWKLPVSRKKWLNELIIENFHKPQK